MEESYCYIYKKHNFKPSLDHLAVVHSGDVRLDTLLNTTELSLYGDQMKVWQDSCIFLKSL